MAYVHFKRYLFLLVYILSAIQISVFSQGLPGNDCSNALRLCSTVSRIDTLLTPDPYPTGFDDLAGGDSVCWTTGERRPFWYKFTVQNTGPFEMNIVPNVDFASTGLPTGLLFTVDWALYDVTSGCSVGPSTLIACKDNVSQGATGIANIPPNANYVNAPTLDAGKTYAIVIDIGVQFISFFDTYINLDFNFSGLPGAVQFETIVPGFTVSEDTVCTTQGVVFTDITTGGDTPYIYDWDFGDGLGTSTSPNPTYNYTANGNYTATLNVGSGAACILTSTQDIVVRDIAVSIDPVADLCTSDPAVTLTGTPLGGAFSGTGVTGNTFDPGASGQGSFVVTYTFTDPDGCTNSDNTTINVVNAVSLTVDKSSEILCDGIGNATFTASGADTYQWFELGNPAVITTSNILVISPAVTTKYAVRGANLAGCFTFDTVTVNVLPSPTVVANASSNPICIGENTNLLASGADTYEWFEVGNGTAITTNPITTVSPTTSTNYFVIGTTTATGCFDTAFITITVNPLPSIGASADANPICPGATSNLLGSGGDTYQWFEVGNGTAIANTISTAVTPLVNTDYFVVGTLTATGCFDTAFISITVNPNPAITATPTTNPICEGENTDITAAGGDTYVWFEVGNGTSIGNSTILNLSPLVSTNYFVIGTIAATGCFDTAFFTLNVNPAPPVTATSSADPICVGESSTLTASGANTYQWFEVGNGIAIANTAATSVSPIVTTNYFAVGTLTATGCFDTAFITITVNPLPTINASADANPICPGATSNLTGSGGDTYQWFEVGNGTAIANTVSTAVTPLVNTDYFVVGTLTATGCFDTAFISITVNPNPAITATPTTNPICEGENTDITAAGGDTYVWFEVGNGTSIGNSAILNVSPAASTDYLVIGTVAATGCFDTAFVTINVNPAPPVTASASADPICVGESSTLTASGANTYQWFEVGNGIAIANTAATSVSPSIPTNYFAVGTLTASGCFDTAFITITVNPLPSIGASADANPICPGATSNLTGSGGDTYQWFEVGNGTAIANTVSTAVTPLVNTDYFVVGTLTATGCFDTAFISITVNPNPAITATPTTNPICEGENTDITAAGGDTYVWFEVGNGTSIGNSAILNVGPAASTDYLVVGTVAATGCFDTAFVTINVNPAPPVTASASADPICVGESSTLTASGANTYQWFEVGNGIAIANTAATSVSPSITTNYFAVGTLTASGCFDTAFITITVNPLPIIAASADVNPICPGATSNLTGSGGDTYQWFEVGNGTAIANTVSKAVTPLVNTDYFVVGTLTATGCFDTAFISITVNPNPAITATPTTNPICEGENTDITAAGGDTYVWFEVGNGTAIGNSAILNVSPAASTDYLVIGTVAATGCFDTAFVTINVNPAPPVTASASADPICVGESSTLTASGANTYQWFEVGNGIAIANTAATSVSPSITTNYFAVGTLTATGCFDTAFITITVNPLPTINASADANPICPGATSNLTGSGGDTYQWFEVGNGTAIANTVSTAVTPLVNTDYFVVGTLTATGCFDTAFISITVTGVIIPTVSISYSPDTTCLGDPILFTSTGTGTGISPTFQWFVNDIAEIGAVNSTFSSNTLNPGDEVKIELTSSEVCASTTALDSVNPVITNAITPNVSLAQSPSPSCSSDPVIFVASPVNGGSNPLFSWTVNGTVQTGISNDTLSLASANNGDLINVIMTSSLSCATSNPSASINANITTILNTSVSINQSPIPTCPGDTATFTASITDGGSNPIIIWKVNGFVQFGETGLTFKSKFLNNGDFIQVIVNPTQSCNSGADTATTTANIGGNLTPTVILNQTPSPICPTDTAFFNTIISNGGTSPAFTWRVNGLVQGGFTGNSFFALGLNNGDEVIASMISSDACAVGTAADTVLTSVSGAITPTVNIIQTPNPVCLGDTALFIANSTGQGTSPVYEWKINGTTLIGEVNDSLKITTLSNGDLVEVNMTSSSTCASGIANNTVAANVTTVIITSVTMIQSPDPICLGDTATFTSAPVSPGLSPTFSWSVNGISQVGETASIFKSNALNNGDIVQVIFTSSESCSDGPDTVSVNANVTSGSSPTVSIVQAPDPNCTGDLTTFTANFTNGGSSPVFTWTVNTVVQAGFTTDTFTTSTLTNGDVVEVSMLSNSSCASGSVTDNVIANITSNIVPTVSISQNPNPVCIGDNVVFNAATTGEGSSPVFEWRVNGALQAGFSGNSFNSSSINNNDLIDVTLISSSSCATTNATNSFNAVISTTIIPNVSLVQSPNSACIGQSIDVIASQSGSGTTPTYAWDINGVAQASSIALLTSTNFLNGDTVNLIMTSSLSCAVPNIASSSLIISLTDSVNPSVSLSQFPSPSCIGDTIQVNANPTLGGTNPSYQWYINGALQAGLTSSFIRSNTFNNSDEIVVEMSSNLNCSESPVFDTLNISALASFATSIDSLIYDTNPVCGGTDLLFRAFVSGQGFSPAYTWTVNGVNQGVSLDSIRLNSLSNGDTVAFALASSSTCASPGLADTFVVISSIFNLGPYFTIVQPSACGNANGIIRVDSILQGSGTYQILINGVDSATTEFNGLGSGSFLITVNDISSACTFDTLVTINVPGAISASINTVPVLCSGQSNGSAQFLALSGGSGFYEFSIDTGATWLNTSTFNNLSPGAYLGIVRDSLDPTCTFQLNFFIGSSFNVSAIIQVDKETTCGANDALINILSVSGGQSPYQFMLLDTLNDTLEPFQPVTATIDSLSAGQYQLVIMDANNCQITILVTINGLVAPSASPVELQAVTCNGGSDGILSLTNSQGGSGVYVYSIDGGTFQSDSVFNNLQGGQHILTINDVNTSCSDNYIFNLSEPDSLSFTINQTDLALCGENIGSLTVQNAAGGNGPYTFEILGIKGPQSSPIFDSLFVGQYTLEISDINSCTKSMIFEVDGTQQLTYDINSSEISCPDNTDGSISISNFVGGVSPFAVSIDNGTTFTSPSSSNVLIASLEAGVYTIVIRDSINCIYTDASSINIENPEPIFANTENITMTEIDSSNGRIAIYDILGGTAPYMISVNADSFFAVNFNQTTSTYDTVLNNFSEGYQTLEIKDFKNCIETFEVYVESYEFADIFTIPNIFTPNSDGYNDEFVIKKLPPNSKLYIFDKNGRPVYDNENYQNDWDAEGLPDGTYFFTLEVENQGVYRGYVEVFR